MYLSGGYFLSSPNPIDQSLYLKRLKKMGFNVDILISIDEKAGGIIPNLFEVWKKDAKSKRGNNKLSENIYSKVLVPNVFKSVEDAREFRESITRLESIIIGISLKDKYLSSFHENRSHLNDSNGEGVVKCLQKEEKINGGGKPIGFDVAGYEMGGLFLSFLGNDLLNEYLALQPSLEITEHGLIAIEKNAEILADFTNNELIEKVGAEELYWLPWRITLYK